MRLNKKPFGTFIFVMLLINASMVIILNLGDAAPDTYFYVDPLEVIDIMPLGEFLITINVTQAPATCAWEIILNWDPTLLNVSEVTEGDFLHRWEEDPFEPGKWIPKYTTFFAYDNLTEVNLHGNITVGCTLLPTTQEWANGTGWLCTLRFGVKSYGSCVLNLSGTRLWDHMVGDYPAFTYNSNRDGFFSNVPVHDIAVTSVDASSTEVISGNLVTIEVAVKNEGNFTETFDVDVYADVMVYNMTVDSWPDAIVIGDEITVGTKTVLNLAPGENRILSFTWNTTSVTNDTYTLSAKSLFLDDDTRDNLFIDNTVTIKPPGAPSAFFNYSPEHPVVNTTIAFNASLSSADGGNITNYLWDFETDGSIDVNTTNPITYHAYTASGTYTVTLTVKDDEGLTDSFIESILIAKMNSTISITASPTSVVGSSATISGAIIPARAQKTVTIHYKPSDGAWIALTTVETDSNGQYSYAWAPTAAGSYELKASWLGDANTLASESDVAPIVVKAPPVASFNRVPTTPVVGETVTFTSTSTDSDGSIVSWNWEFGDGSFANETDPISSHAYTHAGTYTVTLTVADNDSLTDATTQSIVIGKLSSTILINAPPSSITKGESITISGSITPARDEVTVTIWYKLNEEQTWDTLETETDADSQYSLEWTPTMAGTYEVKASWAGDAITLGDESDTQTIAVEEVPTAPNMLLYAIIAIIILVVAAAIVIYFLKFRKKTNLSTKST